MNPPSVRAIQPRPDVPASNLSQEPPLPPVEPAPIRPHLARLRDAFLLCAPFVFCLAGQPLRAADPLTETFQKGLLEEEAHRDLPAAVAAYESVVKQIDEQRRLAATAVFRLGECYRKLGRTNDAVAQFRRIVREFPGEDTLVNLSRQNLVGLGIQDSAASQSISMEIDKLAVETEALSARLERLKTTSRQDVELILKTLFNDPKYWPTGWSAASVAAIGQLASKADDVLSQLERLGTLPKPADDTKIEERRLSLKTEYGSVLNAYQKTLADFISGIEKRLSDMRDVANRFSQQTVKSNPGATLADSAESVKLRQEIALLESQIEQLKAHSIEELPEIMRTIFPDPTLDRLCQDYAVQGQALVALSQDKGPEHPEVVERRAVVETIKKQIERNILGTIAAKELQLQALKASAAAVTSRTTGDIPAQRAALEREINLAENQLATVKKKMEAGAAGTDEVYRAEREILELKRGLAALPSDPASSSDRSADLDQADKIDAQLAEIRTLNGQDSALAIQQVFPSERLTELQRKLAAIFDQLNAPSATSKTDADALKKEAEERTQQEIAQEMQNILRSQELKAQLLRAPGKGGTHPAPSPGK